jgi:excisionase family DNA binding protein
MSYAYKKTGNPNPHRDNGAQPESVDTIEQQPKKAYSVREFCQAFGVSRSHAYNEMKAGRLKSRKSGRRCLIGIDDADDWFNGS